MKTVPHSYLPVIHLLKIVNLQNTSHFSTEDCILIPCTAIIAFFSIPLAPSITVFPINLTLYLKDLNSPVFSISASKSVASSFE